MSNFSINIPDVVVSVDDISILSSAFQFEGKDTDDDSTRTIKISGPESSGLRNYEITWPSDTPATGKCLEVASTSYDAASDTQTVTLEWGVDNSLFIQDSAGGAGTDSNNIYGGTNAGGSLSSGTENFFAGINAGADVSTGTSNVFLGNTTGQSCTVGSENVGLGAGALALLTVNSNNVAVGFDSLLNLDGGSNNIGIGHTAGTTGTTNSQCIIIGSGADVSGASVQNEIVIGHSATGKGTNTASIGNASTTDVYIGQSSGGSPPNLVLIGDDGLDDHTTKIRAPTGIGSYTDIELVLPADAPSGGQVLSVDFVIGSIVNLEWASPGAGVFEESGTNSIYSSGSGNGGAGIGNFSTNGALDNPGFSGNRNIGIGSNAGATLTTGSDNILIGSVVDAASATDRSVAIGSAIIPIGSNSVCMGANIGNTTGGGNNNINIGDSISNVAGAGSINNIYIGSNISSVNGGGADNIVIGNTAGESIDTDQHVIAIGTNALRSATNHVGTIAIGRQALFSATDYNIVQNINLYNTAIGYQALANANGTVGGGGNANVQNTAVGYNAMLSATTAVASTIIGYAAGQNVSTGSGNVLIGSLAGDTITSGSFNIIIGGDTTASNTGNAISLGGTVATESIAVGSNSDATGTSSIAIGRNANATATDSICLGRAISDGGVGGFFVRHRALAVGGTAVAASWLATGSNELVEDTSSIRYKHSVRDYDDNDQNFDLIQPRWFKVKEEYLDDPKNKDQEVAGMIAEELYELYPEYVSLDQDGIPGNIAYHKIVTLLIDKTQRLRQQNKIQQDINNDLLSRISALENN